MIVAEGLGVGGVACVGVCGVEGGEVDDDVEEVVVLGRVRAHCMAQMHNGLI